MTNMTRKGMEAWVKQQRKFVEGRGNVSNPNSRAAQRRRKQMIKGQLTVANGVVPVYECDARCGKVVNAPGLCVECIAKEINEIHAEGRLVHD